MKTNKDFRTFGDDSRGGEQVKGKLPLKEKKSKRSIYDEIENEDVIGYSNFRQKSFESYFADDDDEDDDDYEDDEDEDEDFADEDDDFDDEDDFDEDEYEDDKY
jgi:hypothetical protein